MSEVVVITGASAGVGRATVRAFAKRGASIALLARDLEGLRSAAEEIEAAGGCALPLPTDVADPDAVESAAERVERQLGPIDIWINVAMATIYAPVHRISPAEYRRATEVTYLGNVYGTMAALKRMRPRNRGTIVQVGSALAYRAIPLQAPYCGAKFAIRGFTDSLRSELLHDRIDIHLTMVQMPALNTPQFDWGGTSCPSGPNRYRRSSSPRSRPRRSSSLHMLADAKCGSAAPPSRPFSPTRSRQASSIDISRIKAIAGNCLPSPLILPHRTTCSSRSREITAPMGASMREPRRGVPRSGPQCTKAC